MKRFGDAHWWLVLGPLLLAQVGLLVAWVWGGWMLGRALGGPAPGAALPGLVGAAVGALAWWLIGTALDWLGYRVSYRVTRGRWEFQPLAGALAGWTLPIIVLAVPTVLAALCWGLLAALGVLR